MLLSYNMICGCATLLSFVAIGPYSAVHGFGGLRQTKQDNDGGDSAKPTKVVEDQGERGLQEEEPVTIPEWSRIPSRIPYEGMFANIHFGYSSAVYTNQEFLGEQGLTGVSYYLRAFDMFPKHYTNQLGWGQWVGPGNGQKQPEDAPCPLNPHVQVCHPADDGWEYNPIDNKGNEDRLDCTWPEGHPNLESCNVSPVCNENTILGRFEGGMGYWPYVTGHKGVKWSAPAALSGDYNKYGHSFGPAFTQPCTNMGGAIQIANNLLLPNDFFSFEKDANEWTDGMLGYMLQRTPIGKLHPNDNRNYWTIIADADNFAGPILYSSAYFWEHPNSWQPDIKTFADPDVSLRYFAEGIEGGLGIVTVQQGDWYYHRMTDVEIPLDSDDPSGSTTTHTNHVAYKTDWIRDVLEPVLDGTNTATTPADIRAANAAASVKPECNKRDRYISDNYDPFTGDVLEFSLSYKDNDGSHPTGGLFVQGWGVGDRQTHDNPTEVEDNWCRMKVPVDKNSPFLTCDDQKCRLTPYFRLPVDGSTQEAELISESDMENLYSAAKFDLDTRLEIEVQYPSRSNDGTTLGPPTGHESVCFDSPGPSDPQLYCRRTDDERWIAYRWYRFVDQPELNQVFASLPGDEGAQAKCFMQQRIERLHELQAKEENRAWFEPRGALPQSKAKFDKGFLVTPPAGMEKGYVPVQMYSRVREMPSNCDVVEGEHQNEPDPIPADYYEVFTEDNRLDPFDYPDICMATSVSDGEYDRVGTIYLTKRDGSGEKYPYTTPHKDQVGATLVGSYDQVCLGIPNAGDLIVATSTERDRNKDPTGPWEISPVTQLVNADGNPQEQAFNAIIIQSDWHTKRPKDLRLNACDTSFCAWSHQLGGSGFSNCNDDIDDFLLNGPHKGCAVGRSSYSMCVLPREYEISDIDCFNLEILTPGGSEADPTDRVQRKGAWFMLTDRPPTISGDFVVATTERDQNKDPTGAWEFLQVNQLGSSGPQAFNAIIIESDWHTKRPKDLQLNACDTSSCVWSHQLGGSGDPNCNDSIDDFLLNGPHKACSDVLASYSMCVLPQEYEIDDIGCLDLQILTPGGSEVDPTDEVHRNGAWLMLTDRPPTTIAGDLVVATSAERDQNEDPTGAWQVFPVNTLVSSGSPQVFNTIIIESDWHTGRPRSLSLDACGTSECKWLHQLGGDKTFTCNTDVNDFLSNGPHKECVPTLASYSMCKLPNQYEVNDIACFDLQVLSPGGSSFDTTEYVLRNGVWFAMT